MTATAIGTAIVGALTSALSMVTSIATAVLNGFKSLFFETTIVDNVSKTTLSSFAIVMLVFGGVALAVGIGRLVLNLIRNKVGK